MNNNTPHPEDPEDPEDLAHDLGESPDALEIHERTAPATHTPGPWLIEGRNVISIHEQTGNLIGILGYDTLSPAKNAEANARLIAAAPNLGDIVSRLCGLLTDCADDETLGSLVRENLSTDARIAIAKVTGAPQ